MPRLNWYFLVIALALFSFYAGLAHYTLLNNNEGLYASIAKYMLEHKSFIIPHLNCMPYIEKPPMLYWLLATSFSIFGVTTFAARLIPATSAMLLCLTILFFGYKITKPRATIFATTILATSIGVVIIARMVYFDMLLTFFISGALLCLFYWENNAHKNSLRIAYLSLACAILTKGLIAAILVMGSFIAYLLCKKDLCKIKELFDLPALLVFAGIVLPWHVAAALTHPDFTWHYVINEQFLRFLNLREPHDYYRGSIFYYIPRILIYLFPWSLFLPLLFWKTKPTTHSALKLFLWCWFIIPLIFFSLSSAKANYYMIVSMPALALLLGLKLDALLEKNAHKSIAIWSVASLSIISIALLTFLILMCHKLPLIELLTFNIILLLSYIFIAILITLIFYRKPIIGILAFAGLIVPTIFLILNAMGFLNNQLSAAPVAFFLQKAAVNKPVYLYKDFEKYSALAFYANRCFPIIESHSNDLYYAEHVLPHQECFISKEAFTQKVITEKSLIILDRAKLEEFVNKYNTVKFKIMLQDSGLMVLQN